MGGRKPNLGGQRFGRLTVVREVSSTDKYGNHLWECLCDCGNTVITRGSSLTYGTTKSCGCLRKEAKYKKDLTNQRFGKLTALQPTEKRSARCIKWLCRCDCGKCVEVSSNSLLTGNTRSCGCLIDASDNGKKGRNTLVENEYKDGTCLCALTAKTPNTNKSGRKGVWFDKNKGKWVAYITLRKKRKTLGRYSKFEDAVKARERAEEELFEPVLNAHGRTLYDEEC